MTGPSAAKRRQKQAALEDKLAALQDQIKDIRRRNREHIGLVCERAGLLDLDLSTEELEVAMRDLVARFHRDKAGPTVVAGGLHPALHHPATPGQDAGRDGS
jgi:hypothetical protein